MKTIMANCILTCEGNGCTWEGNAQDLINHEDQCLDVMTECKYGCPQSAARREIITHEMV